MTECRHTRRTEVTRVAFRWWVATDYKRGGGVDLSVQASTCWGARFKLWRFRREARR